MTRIEWLLGGSRSLKRRALLRLSIAGAGASALLAACGGGGSSAPAKQAILSELKDTSSQAKKGGTYLGWAANDEIDLNPMTSGRGGGFGGPAAQAYSRLLREKQAPGGTKTSEALGDLAESWELTDGGTKLTIKLRKDAKFDPRAPTNGRQVKADDVLYSWQKLASISPYRTQLSNAADPASPVESVQKIDDFTLVYKLAFPWAPLMVTLATGQHVILPTESDGQFDARNEARGSGPWMLTAHETSVKFSWRRSPTSLYGNAPYLDGYETPIISEVTTQTAALRSKQIYNLTPTPDNVLLLASELQGIQVFKAAIGPNVNQMFFGSRPGSPFFDVRLRRAFSMSMDRDAVGEVATNAKKFNEAGVPYELLWESHLPAQYKEAGLWLDPKGKEIGEGAKYFEHNIAEAKKLVSAAGYPNGIDVDAPFSNQNRQKEVQATIAADMLAEAGIRLKLQAVDYQTVFLPKIYVPTGAKGDYEGVSFGGSQNSFMDASVTLYLQVHSKGSFTGARIWDKDQTEIDALIDRSLKEFDEAKRKELIQDVQRRQAVYQSCVSYGAGVSRFDLVWPLIQNWGFQGSFWNPGATPPYLNVWLDESKRA